MLMGSELQICGTEILKLRDPNDKLFHGITSNENQISANTLQVDNNNNTKIYNARIVTH